MFIKTLRLKNGYKRFHDLSIDLGPTPARIVALVGPNGCGKSSVLDGLLYHTSVYEQVGQQVLREQSYHSLRGAAPVTWQDIEIQFTTGTFNAALQSKRATGNPKTIFSFRSPYRYNSNVKISEIKSVSEIKLNSYGAPDASRYLLNPGRSWPARVGFAG